MKLEIHNMAGHLIRRLNQIAISVFHDRIKALGHDLTPVQFAAMNAVRHNPGIDQSTLAGLIAYDTTTIGGVIDRLEAKGFVARRISAKDRRVREVTLSARGETLLDEITPAVRAFQNDILSGLDDHERAEFIRLARKAAEAGNHLSRAPLTLRAAPLAK